MIIRKKLPRSHKLYEPIRHEGSHPRPVTRRDFMGAGFLTSSAVLIGSSALVSAFANPRAARAATLAQDITDLQAACGIITNGAGKIPFICFDLAGGANLNGSEMLIGGKGGQLDFLSTAGYGKLGLPGDMLPNSPNMGAPGGNFIDTSLGRAWHSDGAILRGIQSKALHGGPGEHQRHGHRRHVAERHAEQSAQPDVRHLRCRRGRLAADADRHAGHRLRAATRWRPPRSSI